LDTDKDNIPDSLDIDDDNDGVLDADEQKEKSVRKKPKATTKPKKATTKKAKAVKKPTPLPSDVDAMKKAIKERTGKTEAECEDIIAQYRKLRAKAKVNSAKRTEKLKSDDKLITGTNVITPVAQIEKDAEIVKEKIEKQVEQIENKAEREVVKKDKTKDEVKVEVEKKVVKQLSKLSDEMVTSATTFVKNIQTELKKVDKTEAKNFLLGLRNEIDALLSKFSDGGGIPKFYEVGIDEGDDGTNTIANFDSKADAKKFMYDYQLKYPNAKLFIDSVTSDFLNSQQKFGDGGSTIETYNITENESASSVNPSLFARGGGITKTKTGAIKLYYHQTSGGAEYLSSSKVKGTKDEGSMDSEYIVRIDGAKVFGGELVIEEEEIKLYYHQTSGGAEYLSSSKVKGTKDEGSMDSEYLVRIDGAKDFGGELVTKVLPYAMGGGVEDIDYNEILDVLKEKLEDSVQELPIHYENADNFKGEEVEKNSRDGFIAYTNGGYEVTWFEFVYNLGYSGYSLPTSQLDIEMQRQMDYNDKIAKDRFVEEYAEIVEELGIDNIDYHSYSGRVPILLQNKAKVYFFRV
jgi:hypothetical protein